VCVTADYGATYGACAASVTYYDPSKPPELASISPEFVKADAWARATLRLHGANFAPTGGLACHVATSSAEVGVRVRVRVRGRGRGRGKG
jgi:hypothetical protein